MNATAPKPVSSRLSGIPSVANLAPAPATGFARDADDTPDADALGSRAQALAAVLPDAREPLSTAPNAASRAALLRLALQGDDAVLLDDCLSQTNPRVVRASVADLNGTEALALLDAVVIRFLASPRRAHRLLPWVRQVLATHAAVIAASPSSRARLAPLNAAIEERLAARDTVARAAARLGRGLAGVVPAPPVAQAPEVDFCDDSDGEEEDLLADASSGSEHSDELTGSDSLASFIDELGSDF
jgi:hypothetical protein